MKVWALLLTMENLAGYFTGRIAPDERVIFFPTSAHAKNSTHWNLPVHGWTFQPKEDSVKRAAFRSLLRRVLKVPSKSDEKHMLNHRVKSFVVDNNRWKRPKIMLAEKEYSMPPSKKNGHFQTNLTLSTDELIMSSQLLAAGQQGQVTLPKSVNFYALSSDGKRQYGGIIHLVPPEGITILSDIDDTIKITNVVSKKEMLRNTFMKEFQEVPGMAQVYQQWFSNIAATDESLHIHLHLLSASLYQLYEDLEEFRVRCGFPPATYSLKTVRPTKVSQTLQTLFEDAFEFKRRTLIRLFETYPNRKFVLVGDTGEKDPRIYASMAQEYPHQVLGIYLRFVAKGADDDVSLRVQQVMNDYDIANDKWTIFEDASELLSVDLAMLYKNHVAAIGKVTQ